ncbi:hypothetical protein C0993_007412, partial [Termitomyces sp. T159_Od127]
RLYWAINVGVYACVACCRFHRTVGSCHPSLCGLDSAKSARGAKGNGQGDGGGGSEGAVSPSKETTGQLRHRPPAMSQALEAPGPSKTHWRQKPPLAVSQLEIVDFPANILEQEEAAQMLFMKAIVFPAPPEQVAVVVVPTDLCTSAQYNGIVATAAAKKGKHCEAPPPIDNNSDYRESQSGEGEEEEEEGKTHAQRFHHVQWNKKIAKKKANKVKTAAALVHQVESNFLGHISNWSGQQAKIPGMMVYKFAHCGFPSTLFKLEQLHKYYVNLHIPHCNCVVTYMLLTKLQEFVQKCNVSLQDHTMKLLCTDLGYQDMVNPMQGPEDLLLVEHSQIPLRFLCNKKDGMSALHVMCMPNPNMLFDLKQLARYVLIFGRLGLENTWQGIVVHILDDQVRNFSDDDMLHILLYNQILVKWVDHTYTYSVVYLKQQFHHSTMFLDIFQEVDNECLEHLEVYGTPMAILQWDEWHEMNKEDYHHFLFKHAKEGAARLFSEANSLYYYIGMDLNVSQLWKQTPSHSTTPSIGAATNIALTDFEIVDMTAAGGFTTPLRKDSEPHPCN